MRAHQLLESRVTLKTKGNIDRGSPRNPSPTSSGNDIEASMSTPRSRSPDRQLQSSLFIPRKRRRSYSEIDSPTAKKVATEIEGRRSIFLRQRSTRAFGRKQNRAGDIGPRPHNHQESQLEPPPSPQPEEPLEPRNRTSSPPRLLGASTPPTQTFLQGIEDWVETVTDHFESNVISQEASIATPDSMPDSIFSADTTPDKRAYSNPGLETLFEVAGFDLDVVGLLSDRHKQIRNTLFEDLQSRPSGIQFEDKAFLTTINRGRNGTEAGVKETMTSILLPPMHLIPGPKFPELKRHAGKGWDSCIALPDKLSTYIPYPDCTIGFASTAFTKSQLKLLDDFQEKKSGQSLAKAMDDVYFPFLSYEVKRCNESLEAADRQNYVTAAIASRGLYRVLDRLGVTDLNERMMTFSISHDMQSVRIYGYYIIAEDPGDMNTFRFFRRRLRGIILDETTKFDCYTFTANVYRYGSTILKWITDAVDQTLARKPTGLDLSSISPRATASIVEGQSAVGPLVPSSQAGGFAHGQETPALASPVSQSTSGRTPKRKRRSTVDLGAINKLGVSW